MFSLIVALSWPLGAQTYQVGPDSKATPKSPASQAQQSPDGQSLGWGSNIQNARLARAAQLALQRGDHAQAVEYAQRAAQAAPNDPQLWFLLGYAARLDSKTQLAIDAYNHGLHLNPSSLEGLSGLAQTYNVMGRTEDAERLLKQVLAADPRRKDDALLLGDIYMRSSDYTFALDWLGKAERMEPSARSELLMALSYQHLKQMDMANRYLELAKRHAPDNPEVQRSLAGYYRETGNYSAAIASLKAIKNPKPDVTAELAYTYQLDGKLDQAAAIYAQAANAMPRDLGLQVSAAQAAVAAGSIDHADSFLKRAEVIDADYYRLHAIRGQIAQIQERDTDAVREYSSAIAHLPASPVEGQLYGIQLHMDLMQLYKNLNETNEAQQNLEIAKTEIGKIDDRGAGRGQFLRLRALIKMNDGQLDSALSDMNEALALNSGDLNSLQLDGDLLMKMGRTEQAISAYKQILTADKNNRFALTSLGYASRAAGRDEDATKYFQQLAKAYPTLYVPYLALGDMYTAHREFAKAEAFYKKGFALAPKNVAIVTGGMNAAIEAHNTDLAGVWLGRSTDDMQNDPHFLREKERYLRFKGNYEESAKVGREAIQALPKDRDVVVYLGYDLLNLNQYDELLVLTDKYRNVFPQEPDIPLLAGYVHKHQGESELAKEDFTEPLDRDPNVVTAYVNRGYMLNDLHQPADAASDFEAAIKREPKNGEAHLGLAYADLDMHKSPAAVKESELAEAEMGDSLPLHLIRATAYAREGMLSKAADEYQVALKFSPHDGSLYLALAGVHYSQREYHQSIDDLQTAQRLLPNDPKIYALLARSYAELPDKDQTLHYVELAEQHAQPDAKDPDSRPSAIYISTGQALSTVGDQHGAMDRFSKALTAAGSDRVGVRLAIAQLMAMQGNADDAKRQIALAQMEAQTGDTSAPSADQYIAAADVFRSLHEYDLSQNYLERARAAGAPDASVRIGMANNYLAVGDTARAKGELAAIPDNDESAESYQYLMAKANIFRQEHQGAQALTAFAEATNAAGEDQSAEQNLLSAGADEGLRINPTLSVLTNFSIDPIYEDTTVYVLDSKLDAPTPVASDESSLLPPPRSSLQTQWTGAYHLHLGEMAPAAGGFVQIRHANGQISVPSTNTIVNRSTTDYTFNFGVSPTVHFGSNVLTFNPGIQGTIRRDSESPVEMNQNLLREFVYASTSSFFNAVSVSGYFIHESGPFTESDQHSQALTGAVDFRVGSPWGKTALVTGWGANHQEYSPQNYKNYYTASYIGLERRFGDRLNVRAMAEDLRAWRVFGDNSAIAQNLRPSGTVDFTPSRSWDVQGSFAYSSTRGFHVYDAMQSGFSVSYARPFHRKFNAEDGEVSLQYPIRFSAGMQDESFFNFPGAHSQQFRPYVSITLF